MYHITCHITHHKCHKPLKSTLDPLCDTILEMSPPQHQHGTEIHVTGHVMCYITHHVSHNTCHKCHKSLKIDLDPLCDTILEMSPHQHQHGTEIHVTGHVMCYITYHMSQESQLTRNRLGPLVLHHFGNVTTPALTWD